MNRSVMNCDRLMFRGGSVTAFCLIWLCWTTCVTAADTRQPLNIVILYADDWRYDTLGCAGNSIVKTPRLDQLAGEGVRMTHNCATTAICGVSRATLLTGQWMSRHGNKAFSAFQTSWAETYPGLLRENGYAVAHVGKWHNGTFPRERYDFSRLTGSQHWIHQPDGSQIHVTQKNERDALEFLRTRPAQKPFCLTLAFFATHAEDSHPKQYLPQAESLSLYQQAVIPVPRTATDEHFHRLPPFIANERNEARNRWHWRFDSPERYQEYVKNYYRLATEVDAACGRVIDELKAQGVLDQTLVIFTCDNGYFLGEHQLADKWYPYEESIRVPLIIRDPRMPSGHIGTTNDELTLNVDLAPTILAAAQVPAPVNMQGQNLAPLYLAAEPPAWRTDFYYEHATIKNKDFIPSSEALVSREWKYILWPEFQYEELFQLSDDPFEEQNLAQAPQFANQLRELRKRFLELKNAATALPQPVP